MPAPVVVEFLLKGMPAVDRAFRTVEQAAAAAERSRTGVAQRGARERGSAAEQEARAKVRAMQRADQIIRQAQASGDREAIRAVQRAEREKVRIQREATREVTRMARERERENERILREGSRLEERTHREQVRAFEKSQRDRARARDSFARGVGGAVTHGLNAGISRVGRVASASAGMLAQLGGGFSIADSVQREVGLHREAGRIAASTAVAPGQAKPKTADIVAKARAVGIEQAVDPEEVIKAVGKFKDLTGDTNQALALMPDLAKLSTAFGADITELAENAGNIKLSMPDASNADIMRLLRVQTMQGAKGAVELKDMAKYGARLTAGAGLFEGDRATNIATMSTFAQVARQHGGAASPAEATLAAQRFATDIQKNASKFEDLGIKVRTKSGGMRDPRELLVEALAKTGGDVTKLGNLGMENGKQAFGERGVRVMTGFADIYRQAGGGKKGEEAVRKTMADFTEGVSDTEVDARAKERLADADLQLEKVFIELRSAVGSQLLPEFVKMVPTLRDAIPYIAKFLQKMTDLAQWAEQNPFPAIAALLAASVAKEVATAGLGQVVARILQTTIGSQAGVIGAAAAAAIALGIAAMNAEMAAIDVARSKSVGTSTQVFTEAKGIEGKIARGEAGAADVERLKVLKQTMSAQVEDEQKNVNNKGWTEAIVGGLGSLPGTGQQGKDLREANATSQKDREERLRQSKEALDELDKAMAAMLKRQAASANQGGGGGATTPAAPAGASASTGIVQRAVK